MLAGASRVRAIGHPWSDGTAEKTTDYAKYRFMVIDDHPATRQSLRLCIQNMGGFQVEFSGTYGDAIFRLKNAARLPDIILCDYDLGNGRDGQQLFEELRRTGLISDATIFLMVTAERAYEQVVAVVELAPDDYILKPFTPVRLCARLDKLVLKKRFFAAFFSQNRKGNHHAALAALDALWHKQEARRYRYDLLRKRAETFMVAGLYHEAQQQYASIVAISPFPWAKTGMARALNHMGLNNEARQEIDAVVTQAPTYFAAYDLKAKICTETGDVEEAQKTLAHASKLTPLNYVRKRVLAEVALLNGDRETARQALTDIIANDTTMTGNGFATEKLSLMRDLLIIGAPKTKEEIKAALPILSAKEITSLTAEQRISFASLNAIAGNPKDFAEMRLSVFSMESPPFIVGIDVITAALQTEDIALAERITEQMLWSPETAKTFKVILGIYDRHEKAATFRAIQRRVAERRIASQRTSGV